MLEDRRLRVFFVLAQRYDLSGARLAGADLARAGAGASSSALLVDLVHGALHPFQIPGLERYGLGGLALHVSALARDRVLDIVDEMRAVHHAVVGERRDGLRELQRRVGVVALADAHTDRFPREPALLRRILEALHLPFVRGQHAHELAFDIDSVAAPKTELADDGCDVGDT